MTAKQTTHWHYSPHGYGGMNWHYAGSLDYMHTFYEMIFIWRSTVVHRPVIHVYHDGDAAAGNVADWLERGPFHAMRYYPAPTPSAQNGGG